MPKQKAPRPTKTNTGDYLLDFSGMDFSQYGGQQAQQQDEPTFSDKVVNTGKAIAEGITFIPGQIADTLRDAYHGGDIDVTDTQALQERRARDDERAAYVQKYKDKAFDGAPDAMASMGYSAATMGASLGAAALAAPTGPAGAIAAGMGASGTVAYRASKQQFLQQMLGETERVLGRLPSQDEWDQIATEFDGEASRYGLWEAGPEALSNLFMAKLLGPLGKGLFRGSIGQGAKRGLGLYGEEFATETVTQMGQGHEEASAGLRESAPNALEAFKEVAPATFWQTTLMAGGKKGADMLANRMRARSQQVENNVDQSQPQGAEPQTKPFAQEEFKGIFAGPEWNAPEPQMNEDAWNREAADRGWNHLRTDGAKPYVPPFLSNAEHADTESFVRAFEERERQQDDEDALIEYGQRQARSPAQLALDQGENVDLLSLPQGNAAMAMGTNETGRAPIAPPTDYAGQPIATPYTPRPAIPEQTSQSAGIGQWAGGRSQLAYGPKSEPQMMQGLGIMPQQNARVQPQAMPTSAQISNTQAAPRSDTTAAANALGMPAPQAVPQEAQRPQALQRTQAMPNMADRMPEGGGLHTEPPVQTVAAKAPLLTPVVQERHKLLAMLPEAERKKARSMPLSLLRKKVDQAGMEAEAPDTFEKKAAPKRLSRIELIRQLPREEQGQYHNKPNAVILKRIQEHSAQSAPFTAPEGMVELEQQEGKPHAEKISEQTGIEATRKPGEQAETKPRLEQGDIGSGMQLSDGGTPKSTRGRREGSSSSNAANGNSNGRTKSSVKIPNRKSESVSFALIEADDVQASHLPERGFQRNPKYSLENERRYHDEPASQDKVRSNASHLDPDFVLKDSVDANNGAPVIDHEGNVLGGNGRMMSIKQAYHHGGKPSESYRSALRNRIEELGIDPISVDTMKHPVLVRRLDSTYNRDERQALITALNDTFTDSKNARASGKTRGDRLSRKTLEILAVGMKDADSLRQFFDENDSTKAVESLLADGVIQPSERNAFIGPDGLLNPDGKRVIEEALRGRVARSYEVLAKLSGHIVAKIDAAVPSLLIAEGVGGEWNITPHMRDAIDLLGEFNSHKSSSADVFLGQIDLVSGKSPKERFSDIAQEFFHMALRLKKKEFADSFAKFAAQAVISKEAGALPGLSMTAADAADKKLGIKKKPEAEKDDNAASNSRKTTRPHEAKEMDRGVALASINPRGNVVGQISKDVANHLPHKKTGDIRLDKSGEDHIEKAHGAEIRKAGFENARDFVMHVLENTDAVYQGNAQRDFALVSREGTPWKQAVIKLEVAEEDGGYRVKTAGPVRSDFFKNKSPLWERAQSEHSDEGTPRASAGNLATGDTGQSRLSVEKDTHTTEEVNEHQDGLAPGQFLPKIEGKRSGMRLEDVQAVADKIGKLAKNAATSRVVQSFDELPYSIRERYSDAKNSIEGVFDPRSGVVWMVADNLSDPTRAAEVWAHEQIVHHGLRGLLPADARRRVLNQLWLGAGGMKNAMVKDISSRYGLAPTRSLQDRQTVMEEVIAALAEKKGQGLLERAEGNLWRRVVSALHRAWNSLVRAVSGREGAMNMDNIDALLSALGRHVIDGESSGITQKAGPFEQAAAPASRSNNTVAEDPQHMASLAEDTAQLSEHLKRVFSGEGLAAGIRQARKVLGRGVSDDVAEILSNPEMGKLFEEKDLTLLERLFKLPHWIAKDHTKFATAYNRQLERNDERNSATQKSVSEVPLLFDSDKKNRLNDKEIDELGKMIWQWDGKEIPELSWKKIEKFKEVDKTESGRPILEMNPDFYPAFGKWLEKQPQTKRVKDAFLQVRKSLDNDFLKAYAKMAAMSDLADTDLEMYRTGFGMLPNYFPHQRKGKYYVVATAGKGVVGDPKTVVYRKHFDVPVGSSVREEWAKIVAANKKEFPGAKWENPRESTALPDDILGAPIDMSAMEQLVKTAAGKLPSNEQAEEVKKILLTGLSDILKARGFGSHGIERQNIPGFDKDDVIGTLYSYKSGLNGWLTKMEAASDFAAALGKIDAKKNPRLWEYASQYIKDVLRNSDKIDRMAGNIKTVAFAWYLGANIKTVSVNVTQNLIIGVPRLEQYVTGGGGLWLKSAMDSIGLRYTTAGVSGTNKLTKDEQRLIQELYGDGVVTDAYMEELRGRLTKNPAEKTWNTFIKLMGYPMSVVERFNRASLALAAYRAATKGKLREKAAKEFGLKPGEEMNYEQAKEFATMLVRDSHYEYGKSNAPEVFRSSVAGRMASPAYVFRSFGANTLNLYARALLKEGVEGRVFLAKSLGATIALGGLTAFPFYATLSALFSVGDDEDWTTKIRKALPKNDLLRDIACYGVPSMAGFSIGGSLRMETPLTDGLRKGGSYEEIISQGLGDIIGIPYDMGVTRISKAMEAAKYGETSRMIEALVPTAVSNAMQAYRLATRGQTSMKGKPINDPGTPGARKINALEAAGKFLGFQPISSAKSYDAYMAANRAKQVHDEKKNDLVLLALKSRDTGSAEGRKEMLRELKAWNDRMDKENRPSMKITFKSVMQTVAARRAENKPTKKNLQKKAEQQAVWH